MSVGFIMYEIVDKDSLKYQGINTANEMAKIEIRLDIHLKIKVLTPAVSNTADLDLLDIHLNIKALTPCKSEYDEFQLFITKN